MSEKHFLGIELRQWLIAARASELTPDAFQMAKAWSMYVNLWRPGEGRAPPPSTAYRPIREAGFRLVAHTPRVTDPGVRPSSPPRPLTPHEQLRERGFASRIRLCEPSWACLLEALGGGDQLRPWRNLTLANRLIKQSSTLEESVAVAGLTVALTFGYVELASDFLSRVELPPAKLVDEFLHKMRLAFEWGSWSIAPDVFEKWLEIGRSAIYRSPDFDSLTTPKIFYSHQVLFGNFAKLGTKLPDGLKNNLAAQFGGTMPDANFANEFEVNLSAGISANSTIRLDDLKSRLLRIGGNTRQSWSILSLWIMPDGISYVIQSPFNQAHENIRMPGIANRLITIIDERDQWEFHDHDRAKFNYIQWPNQFMSAMRKIYKEIRRLSYCLPDHIVISVNAPFNKLPWQYLVACLRNVNSVDERQSIDAERLTPTVALVSSIGGFFRRRSSRSTVAAAANRVLIYPDVDRKNADVHIEETTSLVRAQVEAFRRNPRFEIGIVIGHGPTKVDQGRRFESAALPEILIDEARMLSQGEILSVLRSAVAFFGSCGVGGPGQTYFGDAGGVVANYASGRNRILIAPIAQVSPQATACVLSHILMARTIQDIPRRYRKAILENAECFLYQMYGFELEQDAKSIDSRERVITVKEMDTLHSVGSE